MVNDKRRTFRADISPQGVSAHLSAENGDDLDDLHFPSIGHNWLKYYGTEDQVMRREGRGSLLEFNAVPRVDIDPHIALLLLMGINDKVTVRRHYTTKEKAIDKVDPSPEETALMHYIDHERIKHRTTVPVILRFPDISAHSKRYREDGVADPNFIEMPVMININPNGPHEEWPRDKVNQLAHPEDTDDIHIGTDASDKLAQHYGFARARDMQNSRPLQLNNHWLRLNEIREHSREKEMEYLNREEQKLARKIEGIKGQIESIQIKLNDLKTGIATPPNTQEELDEKIEKMRQAEAEAESLKPVVSERWDALQERTDALKNFYRDTAPEDRDAHKSEETRLRQSLAEAREQYVGNRNNPGSRRMAALERKSMPAKMDAYERQIVGLEAKMREHEQRLDATCQKRSELEQDKPDEHVYAPTDHTPELVTLNVTAIGPRQYIQAMDTLEEPSSARHKDIERVYRQDIYPRVLDNQSGWLRDALSSEPSHPALQSTKRFFEHMYHQAEKNGFAGDFNAYITRKDSPFQEYITKLDEDSISDEMLYAVRDGKRVNHKGGGASVVPE